MTKRAGDSPELYEVPATRAPYTLLDVERAISELRRGYPVVVRGGGGHAVLALAAETMARDSIQRITNITGEPLSLAITARRARRIGPCRNCR